MKKWLQCCEKDSHMGHGRLARESRGEDVISRLPDDVLIHILSRLETKEAVKTCVLSSRWRYLWTSIYNFYFDDGEDDRYGRIPYFENFVDGVLSVCHSRDVQNFYIDCTMVSDGQLSRIAPWISFAVEHNVCSLNIKVDIDRDGVWPVKLPQNVLTCSSLVELSILSDFVLHIRKSMVCFPSLKKLCISIRRPSGGLMKKLFRCCPVLEDLSIYGSRLDSQHVLTFDINVPTLKMLKIWLGMDYCFSEGPAKHKFVVTACNLEYFHIQDFTGSRILVNERPFLNVAYLDLASFSSLGYEVEGNSVMELLRGISCTKTLSLTSHTTNFIGMCFNENVPTFLNLTHLELSIKACFGWKLFPHFLGSAPNLDVLILQMDHEKDSIMCDFAQFKPKSVPSCLKSHVKVIEIRNMKMKYEEPKVVKYLLSHSEVLKKLLVDFANSKSKKTIQRDILNCSRGSDVCEIEFI